MTNAERYLKGFRIKSPDYIDQIVICYMNVFPEYEIMSRGKEREAAGKLAKFYRMKYPEGKTEEALEAFKIYFVSCRNIPDPWLRNNMSLPIIMSKFNQINTIIKNGQPRGKGATDQEIATAVAKHFAPGSER
jgi:hypothetical protein